MFTWKPGASSDTRQALFGTFAETLAAARQVKSARLAFDQTGDTFHVPPKPGGGAWDVSGIAWDGGDAIGVGPTIYFDDGASLDGFALARNVSLLSLSTSPVIEAFDGQIITLEDGAYLRTDADGLAPFIHVGALVTYAQLNLRYFSGIFSAADLAPIIYTESGSSFALVADFAAQVYDHTLAGDGDFFVDDITTRDSSLRNLGISHTHTTTNPISYSYG